MHRRSGGMARGLVALLLCAPPDAWSWDDGPAASPAGPVEDAEAARLAELKGARAEAILAREEGPGRSLDPAFRAEVKRRLAEAAPEALDLVERRGYGLAAEPTALGDATRDLVYSPIAPCRIVDTRVGSGPLTTGFPRNFYVAGVDGFSSQGGNPAGCGLPRGPATAAVVNFVAVNPSGPGNLRAWAYGGSAPTASIINYAAVGMNIANAVVVPLCDVGSSTCIPGDITVQADVSGTHLVADVVGYFRGVVKDQYRAVVASTFREVSVIVPETCNNAGGTQVTVVAPVAGRVVVQGRAGYNIMHTNGSTDIINTFIGATPTECLADFGFADLTLVADEMPSAPSGIVAKGHAWRVFDVAAGSHTFYLNPRSGGGAGGGNDRISYGSLLATFHPN
jgi:hypothetical protein